MLTRYNVILSADIFRLFDSILQFTFYKFKSYKSFRDEKDAFGTTFLL